jgi:hypothetical protein
MRGVQPLRRRLGDGGEETTDRVLRSESEEPLQQTALVHHLDAARVQAERTDNLGRLRLLLQHEQMYVVQPQLAGQHQAGRSAACHDHVDQEAPRSPEFPRSLLRPTILRRDPGLAASPPVRYTLKVARSG